MILEAMSTPILFADNASVLITHAKTTEFKTTINKVFRILAEWFRKNLMSLNILKTYYINFFAKNSCHRDLGDLGAIM
jgi:hypothetical protein